MTTLFDIGGGPGGGFGAHAAAIKPATASNVTQRACLTLPPLACPVESRSLLAP
jgi:hypothetical protein